MYLHIGGCQMVNVRHIIALFKVHPKRQSKSNHLDMYYKPYIEIEEGPVRSYIVTDDGIYGSPLSLETIIRRYERLFKRPVLGNKDK